MNRENLVQQLHVKAAHGIALSPEEETRLREWYAQLDQEESALLAGTARAPDLAGLRSQVDAAVAQLLTLAQRIQTLTAENEAIGGEIAVLQQQLAQKGPMQPA